MSYNHSAGAALLQCAGWGVGKLGRGKLGFGKVSRWLCAEATISTTSNDVENNVKFLKY